MKVVGTGFKLPPEPPATGPAPDPAPTVRVLVGGRASPKVLVLSSTELRVLAPPNPAGAASLRVENLRADGTNEPGEYATLAGAVTYRRRDLADTAPKGTLVALVRSVLRALKEQVLPEDVVLVTHTDYDASSADELNIVELAKLPAVILTGPRLKENRFYSSNERHYSEPDLEGLVYELPPAYTVDAEWGLNVVSDGTQELVTLQQLVIDFFNDNKWLEVVVDATRPDLGSYRYEMDFAENGEPQNVTTPNPNNVRQFSASFTVRGVTLLQPAVALAGGGTSRRALDISAPLEDHTPPGQVGPEVFGKEPYPHIDITYTQKT